LPSGVTFHDNGNGTATLSGTPTSAGTFNVTFTAQNGVSPNASQNFTLTVQKASSATSITSNSPNPSAVGQAVTTNFSVSGSGTPTGNVTVTASTGETCSGPVPSGGCTLTFNNSGSRTLTASYGGDSNFNGSTSAGVTQSVGDFTISASPASQTISSGKSAFYTLLVTSVGGLTGNVSLSCSAGPPNATCTVSPSSVMLNGSATAKITLLTSKNVNHGTFTLTFTGVLGNLTHSTDVSLTVK
jgi:Big-like domain-containing protein/putative Ig domain-containing protein